MNEMRQRILGVLAGAMDEIATRPTASWRPWWQQELDRADSEAGPLWMPSEMLGDGDEPLPEKIRAAANQCLRKLAAEGLVTITPDGGRRRAKLTLAGLAVAAELAGTTETNIAEGHEHAEGETD